MTWPDLVVIAFVLLFALKGWKRGFVAEIGGFIALAAAIYAALRYPGTFDTTIEKMTNVGEGSAHVIGMVAFALVVYVALMVISTVLSRVARLPIIGIGNGAGGAVVGVVKALLGVWAVVYVALFFPLTHDLREDLHDSKLIALVSQDNRQIDAYMESTMPWWVRPLVSPLFTRHRV